jgi:hypothetical protein
MAFMVCHMEKFSAKDVRGIEIHNERQTENSKNKDIDKSRTKENLELHENLNGTYANKINEIIENGYTSNRKIREDTVKMTSFVVSASPDYIKNLDKLEQDRYFKESYNYLSERVGKSNVISAKVHYDEGTPHMHFCSVPLTQDGRLSAKELFDRKALQEIQKDMLNHLKSKGFDLEKAQKVEKSPHKDFHEWKKEQENEFKTLKNDLESFNKQSYDEHYSGVLKSKFEGYIVPKDNLIEIRNYARQGILLKSEVERLKNIEKKYIKTAESLEEYNFKCEKLQNAFNNMHKVLEFSKEISPQVEEKINKFVKNKEFHTWKNKEEREKEQMNQSKNRSKGFER